jgi:glutathione S-transferase
LELAREAFGSVSDILGDSEYLLGDNISIADFTVYAFLAQVLINGGCESNLSRLMREYENLEAYVERMHSLVEKGEPIKRKQEEGSENFEKKHQKKRRKPKKKKHKDVSSKQEKKRVVKSV